MKLSVAAVVAAYIAFVAAADGLNECEQRCVTAMQGQASQLGCADGDAVCLCANQDFNNGLRDCGAEACNSSGTLSFAASYCKDAVNSAASSISEASSLIASATSAAAETSSETKSGETSSETESAETSSETESAETSSETESAEATTTVTSSQGEETVTTSLTSTATGAIGGNVPISTIYSVSAIVDGSSTKSVQTLGSSTVYSSISDATPVSTQTNGNQTTTLYGTGSGNSSSAATTSAIVSTVTNESTTFETTVGSSTISKAAESTLTDENGKPTATSSEGAGARQTVGAAFMAVAGLAALVL